MKYKDEREKNLMNYFKTLNNKQLISLLLREYNENKELNIKYNKLKNKLDKITNFINEYCIDDEFVANLSKKEKNIIEVKEILESED